MNFPIAAYEPVVGPARIAQLYQLGRALQGAQVVHVNATRAGGGVAEILAWLVPLMNELGLHAAWEVIEGNPPFFQTTKTMHNGLQGNAVELSSGNHTAYTDTLAANAERLRARLQDADFVFIHDPQPAALLGLCPDRRGKWIWRCHIDVSRPFRTLWKFLQPLVEPFDASVFSIAAFAQPLSHPQFVIAPSIDPLSPKNEDLTVEAVDAVYREFQLDRGRPLLVQISRFDRFKDPVGVIAAYRMVRRFAPVQLVLAGGGATDDPEGAAVLEEVHEAAGVDPDIHVLLLPPDAHTTINALQRAADIILQKSTREGFGLTVTEGLWKGKPVIGGDVGGIRVQVFNGHTGFLVNSPEGAALRIRWLLLHRAEREQMGRTGREFVRENFVVVRQLREYLTLMLAMRSGLATRLVPDLLAQSAKSGSAVRGSA